MYRIGCVVAVAVLLLIYADFASPQASASTTFVVWVSPSGVDSRSATTPQLPVATLSRAQALLKARQYPGPTEVRVAAGTYTEWGVRWSYHNGYPVRITAYNGIATFTSRGQSSTYGLRVWPTSPFTHMRLTISGFRWMDATNGVQIYQARGVRLERPIFERIGSSYGPDGGYAALLIHNSSGTVVEHPVFRRIENVASHAALVHAIYIAHASHDTVVRSGTFSYVTGDAIRVRNGSHRNVIDGGSFFRAGRYAVFSEWYNPASEFRSRGNRISASTLGATAYNGRSLPLTACFAAGNPAPLPTCYVASV